VRHFPELADGLVTGQNAQQRERAVLRDAGSQPGGADQVSDKPFQFPTSVGPPAGDQVAGGVILDEGRRLRGLHPKRCASRPARPPRRAEPERVDDLPVHRAFVNGAPQG
jgi:hypothetical protein